MPAGSDVILAYAMQFVGKPYIWGGKSPLGGMDCSGFVSELLKAQGKIGNREQLSSSQMFDRFKTPSECQFGALAFYGTPVEHVAFCLSDSLIIEAAGGDHTTLTDDDALARNAFVKVRYIKYRNDFIECRMP